MHCGELSEHIFFGVHSNTDRAFNYSILNQLYMLKLFLFFVLNQLYICCFCFSFFLFCSFSMLIGHR